jgi:hypothetical protein
MNLSPLPFQESERETGTVTAAQREVNPQQPNSDTSVTVVCLAASSSPQTNITGVPGTCGWSIIGAPAMCAWGKRAMPRREGQRPRV